MTQHHRLPYWLVALCACLLTWHRVHAEVPATQPLQKFEYQNGKMGTLFHIVIWASDQPTADNAADAAWARIDQLNKTFSDYDPESELSRLSHLTDSGPMSRSVAVSDDMAKLLSYSIDAAKRSDGKFDVTIGPLSRLQRQARKEGKLPDPSLLKEAEECVGWRYIELDEAGRHVKLTHADMRLDVGGIAKGYTSDRVVELLKSRGLTQVLCGAAGDITAGDAPPARNAWRIGIASVKSPGEISDHVQFHNYAVSTSGDAYRSAEVDGKTYSHIIDTKTGLGLTKEIGVTTIAPQGVVADWTATAISILGPERGLAMIDDIDGAAARVVTIDASGNEVIRESKRFAQFLVPKEQPASAPAMRPLH